MVEVDQKTQQLFEAKATPSEPAVHPPLELRVVATRRLAAVLLLQLLLLRLPLGVGALDWPLQFVVAVSFFVS